MTQHRLNCTRYFVRLLIRWFDRNLLDVVFLNQIHLLSAAINEFLHLHHERVVHKALSHGCHGLHLLILIIIFDRVTTIVGRGPVECGLRSDERADHTIDAIGSPEASILIILHLFHPLSPLDLPDYRGKLSWVFNPSLRAEDELESLLDVIELSCSNPLSKLLSELQLVLSHLFDLRLFYFIYSFLRNVYLTQVLRHVEIHVVVIDDHEYLAFHSHLCDDALDDWRG